MRQAGGFLLTLIACGAVLALPAGLLTVLAADHMCRGVDCSLSTLAVRGPLVWGSVSTVLAWLIWRRKGRG